MKTLFFLILALPVLSSAADIRSCLVDPPATLTTGWPWVAYPKMELKEKDKTFKITEVGFFNGGDRSILARGEDSTGKSYLMFPGTNGSFESLRGNCKSHPQPKLDAMYIQYNEAESKRSEAALRRLKEMDKYKTCLLAKPVEVTLREGARTSRNLREGCRTVLVGQMVKRDAKTDKFIRISDDGPDEESIKGPGNGRLVLETCSGDRIFVDDRDLDAKTAGEVYHRFFHCKKNEPSNTSPMPELQSLPEPGSPTSI
ncbi:MAG: hypothetical protein AB7F86_02550 [Bdellovibrionales bacterium]